MESNHTGGKSSTHVFDDSDVEVEDSQDDTTVVPADTSPTPASTPPSQKSVRFSADVKATTFQRTDPPNPLYSPKTEDAGAISTPPPSSHQLVPAVAEEGVVGDVSTIIDKEHLQLMPEEAFFLTFGLGALSVIDPSTQSPIPTKELLSLFRQHSSYPSQGPQELQPDDRFLVHYAVYHHFRSLGWVPRGGIKFGVDWLLYHRGPVFDHAEFGLIIVPSFTHDWWKENGGEKRSAPHGSWAWLHGVLRVLSHAVKSFVLVYVDIPPPPVFEAALARGAAEALRLYEVREVMVRRWSANRNRKG